MSVREEVMERLIEVIRDAEDKGLNGVEVAAAAFPGTPTGVLYEAWAEMDMRRTEQWWQTVEKTIDGEIIKAALLTAGGKAVQQ